MAKKITVRRKGYRYYKPSIRRWVEVRPTTYERKDVGAPGKGEKVLPPIKHPGAMTAIARMMGYGRPSDIPDNKIPEFVDNLVDAYGERKALGMIMRIRVYRKRLADGVKEKFEKMYEYWVESYGGEGWKY